MLYIPGVVASVCHGVLLFGGAVLHASVFRTIGFSEDNSRGVRIDWHAIILLVGHQFFPTFTMLCYGFSWLACAYHSEAGGYCMVLAPVAYALLWAAWLFFGKRLLRCGGCGIHKDPRRAEREERLAKLDPIDRVVFKNEERDRRSTRRAIEGGLFGSDRAFYETHAGTPEQRRARLERALEGAEHSPYLVERLQRDALEEEHAERLYHERQASAKRQRRFNKAFEDHQAGIRLGVLTGPFIFDGEIVPVDDEERAQLEAIRDAGAVPVYQSN